MITSAQRQRQTASYDSAEFFLSFSFFAQSLKPVKLFSQQLPTFLLFRDRRSVAQQCWIRLHSSSNIVGATHAHYTWITKTFGLYPSQLLHPFAHHCQHTRNNSQHCWRNNVGSCCVQTDATLLPNNSQHCWTSHVESSCSCVTLVPTQNRAVKN